MDHPGREVDHMARAAKKEKEVSLETVLWNCRVALRGIGSTEKNRDAVISLVFLKFAGDKFEKRRAELMEQYGDIPAFLEKVSFYNADNVFYLKETARWSYIVAHASSNDIAVILAQCKILCDLGLRTYSALLASMIFKKKYSSSG